MFGVWTEFGDDLGVGEAVAEHEIDLLADGLGQVGDFSGAAPVENEAGGTIEGVGSEGVHFYTRIGV